MPAARRIHKTARARTAISAAQPASGNLHKALDFLERMDELEESQATVQVAYHLNRWVDVQTLSDDWTPDPLTRRLPRAIREGDTLEQLARPQFHLDDIRSMMQSVWMRGIARWVSREPVAGPLGEWWRDGESDLKDFEVEQIRTAERLFDWTVRSVQLDETLPYPDDPLAVPSPGTAETTRPPPPPQRGVPGPGYQFHPWQTLIFGRGDALARARVFIRLARQQDVDVVMLAFPGQTTPPRPRPWLPAVLVRDQLYLFDPRLGLPIPSGDDGGIATLTQVIENADLLSDLAVGTEHTYPVTAKDLDEVIAMIDASPQDVFAPHAVGRRAIGRRPTVDPDPRRHRSWPSGCRNAAASRT